MLDDRQLEQFSRQLLLDGFGVEQQRKLLDATVAVVGLGGLGSPVSMYLAAAGIGRLILIDHDQVERSNLPRQVLYGEEAIGVSKANAAGKLLSARCPRCEIVTISQKLTEQTAVSTLGSADVIADCTDDYHARYALNHACIETSTPLVSAAAVRGEGQLTTFAPSLGGPCYQCLYPTQTEGGALSCSEAGVLGPVVGVLGTLQALEVIKMLTGWGENLVGSLQLIDLTNLRFHKIAIPVTQDCRACR
ncbi:MAG: HesA/MoeB/ThiF family protein [Pseudomonadota bacterium]